MSYHPSYLLGEALEALTEIADAASFTEALMIADNALARIPQPETLLRGIERGAAAFRTGDGAGAPPVTTHAGNQAADSPAPSPQLVVVPDPEPCEHRMGAYTCTRDAHPGPGGHVYMTGSWVPDRHHGAN